MTSVEARLRLVERNARALALPRRCGICGGPSPGVDAPLLVDARSSNAERSPEADAYLARRRCRCGLLVDPSARAFRSARAAAPGIVSEAIILRSRHQEGPKHGGGSSGLTVSEASHRDV